MTDWQELRKKEKILKARKPDFKMTFRKGLFVADKERIIEYIKQPDVLLRAHWEGSFEDETGCINITIEGYKNEENSELYIAE